MLKSTYKPDAVTDLSLPEGWTEHKAPTGHSYFYNSATKESTYNRPTSAPQLAAQISPQPRLFPQFQNGSNQAAPGPGQVDHQSFTRDHSWGRGTRRSGFEAGRRQELSDRPKSKVAIPGCEPWVLVTTKLGRRFVHNRDSGESFWRFPYGVMRSVVAYDKFEREKKAINEANPEANSNDKTAIAESKLLATNTEVPSAAPRPTQAVVPEPISPLLDSDGEEYEEVEVTDDEAEGNPFKRQKTENDDPNAPVEFNEDDIAYQLAAMGHDYGLDPGEYDDGDEDGDLEEGAEGLPLTMEDSSALFKDMLDDHHISPYTLWDKLVEAGQIVEDDRYTVLPNMRARKEVFSKWSREKIERLKDQRAREEKKDPRIPYFALLESKATPKLYWPEFKRKYKHERDMKNINLSDKDREKAYREHINRLKLPESTLKADFVSLLQSIPIHALNRSSTLDTLPAALLTDLRYISLRSATRNSLIEAYISTLPPAPVDTDVSPEEETARAKEQKQRDKRERALAERQRKVEEEKRKQKGILYRSKGMLREEEEEVQRAMQIGKEGLLGYMQPDEQQDKQS